MMIPNYVDGTPTEKRRSADCRNLIEVYYLMRFDITLNEIYDFLSLYRAYGIMLSIFEFDEETLFFMSHKKPDFPIPFMAEIAPIAVCSPASACPNGFVKELFFIFNYIATHNIRHFDFHGSNRPSDYNSIFRNN